MSNFPTTFTATTGQTLSAYPLRDDNGAVVSLANWTTYRVACTESASPNAGIYSVTVTDSFPEWAIMAAGAGQPASWAVDTGVRLTIVEDTVNVLPFEGSTPERVNGTNITVFQDENTEITLTYTGQDFTGLDLEFIVEDQDRTDILSVAVADMTVTVTTDDDGVDTTTVTLEIPDTITSYIANHRWALRDKTGTNNEVLDQGVFSVTYAADS